MTNDFLSGKGAPPPGVLLLKIALFFGLVIVFASPDAVAQVFWARSFTSNNSTSVGGNFASIGGAVGDSWGGSATFATAEYLGINGTASGYGTLYAGSNSTATIDLSQRTDVHLLVTLRLDPTNAATQFRIGLRSGSGNQTLWSLPALNFSRGKFTTVSIPLRDPPVSSTGLLNLSQIDRVLFQGDYSGSTPLRVQLERIAIAEIPERGVVRIVGAAEPGDPYDAAYYSTIQSAVTASRPRDTVWVRPGIYNESVSLTKDYALPETALRIVADPSGPVILDGNAGINGSNNFTGLEYGFDWSNEFDVVTMIRANHIEIEGFIIRNYVSGAFGNRNPGKILIQHCLIHSNGSAGIAMNFPRADTRIRAISNIVFLNGWGEGWAGGIHLNNKDVRLNSLAADANRDPLPEDDDYGHEVIGNICFLNLDESEYNSDGNGIMIDFGGGSEALISDNICFMNAGAGIRNLNGRADIKRNIIYRNGWDHRAAPSSSRSTNEQVGFLIRLNSTVSPGLLFDEFIERHYPQFIKSRFAYNIVWTASQFNYGGPFYTYINDTQQNASLSQFALEYGIFSTFNGKPDSSKWWRVAYGYELDTSTSNSNQFTDDIIGAVNPQNSSQNVQPQTRQSNLRQTFLPSEQLFTSVPSVDYVPPAYQHIYGQSFRDVGGSVIALSESTQSIGMVWDTSVKENISPKLATVVTNPPVLDLKQFDFTILPSAATKFQNCKPTITFAPAYRSIFEDYLRDFEADANSGIPYTTVAASNPQLPSVPKPPEEAWVQAEDLYSTTLHKTATIPRWRLEGANKGPFASPFLQAYDLDQLSDLNDTNSLRTNFELSSWQAPVVRLVVQSPTGANPNNDSIFVRLKPTPTGSPVVLPLKSVYQSPGNFNTSKVKLTPAGSGWYRLFFDNSQTGILHLHVPLPTLAAGTYELQFQNRQADVRLDKMGVFLLNGEEISQPYASPAVTFADWQSATLPSSVASQPQHQDPFTDASGNGLANILQVLTNSLTTNTTPFLLTFDISPSNSHKLEFPFNGLITGYTTRIQESTDLVNWSDVAMCAPGQRFQASRPGVVVNDAQGGLRTVILEVNPAQSRVFYRFYVD